LSVQVPAPAQLPPLDEQVLPGQPALLVHGWNALVPPRHRRHWALVVQVRPGKLPPVQVWQSELTKQDTFPVVVLAGVQLPVDTHAVPGLLPP
jgi:hypothetical protein